MPFHCVVRGINGNMDEMTMIKARILLILAVVLDVVLDIIPKECTITDGSYVSSCRGAAMSCLASSIFLFDTLFNCRLGFV